MAATTTIAPPRPPPSSFSDLPEDVQLTTLSFLSPTDVSSFASTSHHFLSLCSQPKLWFSICHRRWGPKTHIHTWLPRSTTTTKLSFIRLYKTLDRWENLIGFWRRTGHHRVVADNPPLVFFEWGKSFVAGYRISPSEEKGGYGVVKRPFLWLGVSAEGKEVCFLGERFGLSGAELVPVTVSFVGRNHLVLEESGKVDSPSGRVMEEVFKGFGDGDGDGVFKWKRMQWEHRWRRRWETERFVKVEEYYPTPSRPLQGLWKGICEDMNLDFFLVTYDDVGGIACRRVGDASEPFSCYSPVFWTSNTTFLEIPFPREEEETYANFVHVRPLAFNCFNAECEVVSRILRINSSYDLVIHDLSGSSANLQNVEGRIWEYKDGTFGFGFLRNNFIIDLKHIALNGYIFDCMVHCNSAST